MDKKVDALLDVSVVIPMYNEIRTIDRCIGSILRQDYPQEHIEIVIVDGGSQDGCRERVLDLANVHPNIRLLENPDRRTAKSLNIGIKSANGDVVIILGAHTETKNDSSVSSKSRRLHTKMHGYGCHNRSFHCYQGDRREIWNGVLSPIHGISEVYSRK